MAGIDKIYGTPEQYYEFRGWCEDNCPQALDYFYPEDHAKNAKAGGTFPMTNLPEAIDMWLLENCPLNYIVERIMYQYNLDPTSRARPESERS